MTNETYIDLSADSDIIPKPKKRKEFDRFYNCDWDGWIHANLDVLGEGQENDPFVYIRCPWSNGHTTETGDKDTQVFYSENSIPRFFCHHAHCAGLTFLDLIEDYDDSSFESYLPKEKKPIYLESVDTGDFSSPVDESYTSTDYDNIIVENVDKLSSTSSRYNNTGSIFNTLTFLGEAMDGRIVVKSNDSEILKIVSPSTLCEKGLLSIYTSGVMWLEAFSDGKGKHQRLNVTSAVEWLLKESKKAGSYDDKKRAGLGLHWDNKDGKKRIVLNTGKNIYCEGKFYTYSEAWREFENYYILVPRKINLTDDIMPKDLPKDMFRILAKLSIKNIDEALVFFGANILLMMCGILSIRPLVQVNGPRQSGKSQILMLVSSPLLIASGGVIYSVGTSAAGLVQSIMGNVSFVFDEFEPDSITNERAIDSINDIMLASSTTGSEIYKGTKNQVPIQNSFKSGGIFGAIGNKTKKAALEIRSIFVNIINSGDTSEQWLEKKKNLEEVFCAKNCQMFYRFLVDHADLLLKNIELCSNVCAKEKNVETTTATLYGSAAGAFITALYQREYDYVKDKKVMNAVYNVMMTACDPKEKVFVEQDDMFINSIMSLELKDIHRNVTYTLEEFLKSSIYDTPCGEDIVTDSDRVLTYYGIKVDKENNVVWFSNNNRLLNEAFEKNKIQGYKDRLKNLKGIQKSINPIRFGASKVRALGIPISDLEDRLKPDDKNKSDITTETLKI